MTDRRTKIVEEDPLSVAAEAVFAIFPDAEDVTAHCRCGCGVCDTFGHFVMLEEQLEHRRGCREVGIAPGPCGPTCPGEAERQSNE